MIIPKLTQAIITTLFAITALTGLLAASLGIILPGLLVTIASFIGIWAILNTK